MCWILTALFNPDSVFDYIIEHYYNHNQKRINFTGDKNNNQLYKYLVILSKKENGQDIGVKIGGKENVYRQDFCGCEFSIR